MAYNSSVKLEAENLFLRGYNLNQIVEMLKKKYPKISYSSVLKWSETKDKSGRTWKDIQKEVVEQARAITHTNLTNKYALLKQKAEILKENLEEELLNPELKTKSKEGGIYAWKSLNEMILMIEDKYESKKTPKEIVLEFLDILNSVPQIKDVLKKNWNLVEEELKRRINEDWK